MERFIIHVDMDAFFAAIEQRDRPQLRGKPVIVGADPRNGKGRGVVSTCSYEARKFGIHSAMPISFAYKRCPQAVFLTPDMAKYGEVSRDIHSIFYDFTPKIEPVSIDEAFLDITGSLHIFKTPLNAARLLKSKIKQETGLTASIGIAPTKMAAKIASDLNKPDGLVEVKQIRLLEFLWPLDIGKIWGLGKKSQSILNNLGIRTIGELARLNVKDVKKTFGKNGEYFWHLANGIDEREVEFETEAKSISNEFTFSQDTQDRKAIEAKLSYLCEKVSSRLRTQGLKGRTITLKVRLQGFNTYTRAKTLTRATNFVDSIYKIAKVILDKFSLEKKKIRLIGVKVSGLTPQDVRDSIFSEKDDGKNERIHKAVDAIKGKFGNQAIHRAASRYPLVVYIVVAGWLLDILF